MFLLFKTVVKVVVLAIVLLIFTVDMADVNISISDSNLHPVINKTTFSDYVKYFPNNLSPSQIKAWFGATKSKIRPWGEFLNSDNFKSPPSFQRMLKRALNNISHFQGNYIIIGLLLMAYSLLTSPLLLIAVVATLFVASRLSAWNSSNRLTLGGVQVTVQQQYLALGICSLPVFYWVGVGDLIFWVLGATGFITSLHAAFYNIDAIIQPIDQIHLTANEVV